MIRVLDGMPEDVLGLDASGKLTAEDYTDVLRTALSAMAAKGGKIRIVLVFTGEFDGMEAGAVWQDIKTGVQDWNAWERIALVTDKGWVKDGLRLFAWAVPGEVKVFGPAELESAVAWAAAS